MCNSQKMLVIEEVTDLKKNQFFFFFYWKEKSALNVFKELNNWDAEKIIRRRIHHAEYCFEIWKESDVSFEKYRNDRVEKQSFKKNVREVSGYQFSLLNFLRIRPCNSVESLNFDNTIFCTLKTLRKQRKKFDFSKLSVYASQTIYRLKDSKFVISWRSNIRV